jgi:hypothetical protein
MPETISQTLVTALVVMSATTLMVQAGLAKRMLSWRPVERRLRRPRRTQR